MLGDPDRLKLFHFARFDMAMLKTYLGIDVQPVYCTKIASKLVRTYTDRHGLKDLCRELLGVDLSKVQQSSDWGALELSAAQQAYAAQDVLHLHALRDRLEAMLEREGRQGNRPGLLRFPRHTSGTRPARLAGDRYFCTLRRASLALTPKTYGNILRHRPLGWPMGKPRDGPRDDMSVHDLKQTTDGPKRPGLEESAGEFATRVVGTRTKDTADAAAAGRDVVLAESPRSKRARGLH